MTSTTSRKRSISIWNFIKIVLALGLVMYVLSRSEPLTLISTLKSGSIFWLLVSVVLYLLLTFLKALQYYVFMRGKLTYLQVLNVIIWQNAVTNFFLAGAGIAAYITLNRLEHEVKISRSVTTFLLTKMGDLIAIWLVLMLSSGLVWSKISVLQTPVLFLMIGIGFIILFFFLTILFRHRFISLLNSLLKWTKLARVRFLENGMNFLQGLANTDQNTVLTTFGLLFIYSLLYLVVTIIFIYANLAIFHVQPDIPSVMFVSVLIQLVSYVPIGVFGGLGITETSALYFWSFFEVPQDILAPALIGIRVIFYLFNLIPLIYLPLYSAFLKPKQQAQNEP